MNRRHLKRSNRRLTRVSRHILDETRYHDKNAESFIEASKKDLIWQIPEEMVFTKYLGQNKKWVLFDLGCGPAENIKRNVLPKMRKGDVYVGVDVSKRLLDRAKQNMPRGEFIQAPMGDLKMPRESVDYLSFFGALHHDEKPQRTLKKVVNFLKPGGYVFLREPQEKVMKRGCGASPHEGGLNPSELRGWLENSGLNIVEWHFLNTIPFHLLRRLLTKLRLSRWEEIAFFWKIKVWLELILERLFVGFLTCLEGTDMFIVAQKPK